MDKQNTIQRYKGTKYGYMLKHGLTAHPNSSNAKDYILYDSRYIMSRKAKSVETESRISLSTVHFDVIPLTKIL